ncbi:hypothetical protein RF11_14518 [Thelohanellus kitauei]|uniref:Uncharacterized protein n=1 Tax=Thelohanellus kitauei TaxID=669202 RepID=A0A0C2IY34_THEKT|nr:hypothetical protein RF11_14518 [Thelohanellus kitauei]
METDKYLWVGTTAGLIVVIVKILNQDKKLILPMRTTVLTHGHAGPVRFITLVKLPKNIKFDKKEDSKSSKKSVIENKFENSLIITGGEGIHDYTDTFLSSNVDLKHVGNDDHTCTIITWSIVT